MQFRILRRSGRISLPALGAGICLSLAGFGLALAVVGQAAGTPPAGSPPTLNSALVAGQSAAQALRAGCANRAAPGLKAYFGTHGAEFTGPRDQGFSLRLAAFGRPGALISLGSPERTLANGSLIYRYAGLTEWWRTVPQGFEQGFTVFDKPAGEGRLVLVINANSDPRRQGENLGWGALRYGGLAVVDARGTRLPAELSARDSRIAISVDDGRAVYPVTVDPTVWLSELVAPSSATSSNSASTTLATATATVTAPATIAHAFGAAVLLDGGTAFIGAPYTSINGSIQQGAVYVFTRTAERLWEQTAILTSSDAQSYDQFGSTLAIAGTNLVIGAPGATVAGNDSQGAAYVFNESGGNWTQAQKLTAGDGAASDEFGGALAISGTTLLAGARYASVGANIHQGAVYVFDLANGSWTQAQKLTASDGAAGDLFGAAVALDGAQALIGASGAGVDGLAQRGAAYVFALANSNWSQTQKLVASDGLEGDLFGAAVALDADSALVAAPDAGTVSEVNRGKVYAYDNSAGTLSLLGVLIPEESASGDQFGGAMVLTGDNALIGSAGGSTDAYLYQRAGGEWTESADFPGIAAATGSAVALQDLGALIGAPFSGTSTTTSGLAQFFAQTDLAVTLTAPATAKEDDKLPVNIVFTNSSATITPPVNMITLVPANVTYLSATTTQGECNRSTEVSTFCQLGQLSANGGSATITVNYQVTKVEADATITNAVSVIKATPGVTASAATRLQAPKSSGGGGGFALFGLLGLAGLLAAGVLLRARR